jgi:UDP-2,3-diacylglucosamine pyrophosphatase LpxH
MPRQLLRVLAICGLLPLSSFAALPAAKAPHVWRVAQDGSGDFNGRDEQPILQAVARAKATGGRIEIGPGEYTIRQPLVLGSNLTLRGHGTTLRLPSPTLVSKPAAKGAQQIAVDDGSSFRVGTKLQIVPPVGMITFPGTDKKELMLPIVQVGPQGIALGAALECDVPAHSRVGYRHSLIQLFSPTKNVRIEQIVFEGGRNPRLPMPGHVWRCAILAQGFFRYASGPSAPPVENLQVLGCTIRNCYGRAVAWYSVVKSKVEGCTIEDIDDEAVDLDHFCFHCVVNGNRIARGMTGVTINDGSYCTVTDNRIDQCGVGVTVWWWHDCPQTTIDLENLVRGNFIWRSHGPAISFGKRCFRNRAEQNFVDGPIKVVEKDCTVAGNVTIGKLRGRVTGDGKPLAGVLVSDGCRVVRTDAAGCYQLSPSPESGPFVFVTTPPGYWTDAFYCPLAKALTDGQADFALRAIPVTKRFEFVFITDMHLESGRCAIPKTKASFAEINALRPAFVWAQGDLCLQGHMGPAYQECLATLKVPVCNGPGNHEMMTEHVDPRDDYHRLFGPSYYSFDWSSLHCVVLDGNKVIPSIDSKSYKAVHGSVEGSELRWLEADLAAQPKGRPIVVGIHIPIITTYPERRRENPKDAPYWEVTNRAALTDLFARYGVRLVLQGHMHENERITVKGVEYVESVALSGSWFKSGAGLERNVDGCPRGYRIVTVDGARITHRYCSTAESRVERQGELVGAERPFAAGRPVPLLFNCYDAPQGSTAECRVDQGAWQPMPPFAAVNESLGLKMCHHFRLQCSPLAPGHHQVEVRVRWPDGTRVVETATIQVTD